MSENSEILNKKYEILGRIKGGGQGTVSKARCISDKVPGLVKGDLVAVKRVQSKGSREEELNFRRETETLRKLNHPHIVRYRDSFDYFQEMPEGKVYCLVMELLEGEDLKLLIEHHLKGLPKNNPKGLPWPQVRKIFVEILTALDYLSNLKPNKVVHRDLKPSNIFVTLTGDAKLIDFGIARDHDSESTASTAGAKGTWDYMAPDFALITGFHGDELSDIFSFGVCFYHALAGKLPFKELNAMPDYFIRWHKEKPDPDYTSPSFRVISRARTFIARCMAIEREERFQTFSEALQAFNEIEYRRLENGSVVYEFTAWLGRGGFGEVFRARRMSDGKELAIKRLFTSRHSARFIREAKILRDLTHPGLVKYVDFFEKPISGDDAEYYLVLEYLPGMPEASLRDRIRATKTGMDPKEALRFCADYLDCLDYLHKQGIIHRDIKPGNLYAPDGGAPGKIFDLGIAHDEEGTRTHGQVPGTLDYMPPEFAMQDSGRGSAQSDVYSIGVTLYQSLTGLLPFPRLPDTESAAWGAFYERAEKPIPVRFDQQVFKDFPGLVPLLKRSLAHSPLDRHASAGEMRDEIRRLLDPPKKVMEDDSSPDTMPPTANDEEVTKVSDSPGKKVEFAPAPVAATPAHSEKPPSSVASGSKSPSEVRAITPEPVKPPAPPKPPQPQVRKVEPKPEPKAEVPPPPAPPQKPEQKPKAEPEGEKPKGKEPKALQTVKLIILLLLIFIATCLVLVVKSRQQPGQVANNPGTKAPVTPAPAPTPALPPPSIEEYPTQIQLGTDSDKVDFSLLFSDANTAFADLKLSLSVDPEGLVSNKWVRGAKDYEWDVTMFRVPNRTGSGKLTFKATGKGGSTNQTIDLMVLAPTPPPAPVIVSAPSSLRLEATSNQLNFSVTVSDTNTPFSDLKFSLVGSPDNLVGIKSARDAKDYQWDITLSRKADKSGSGKLALAVEGKGGSAPRSIDLEVIAAPIPTVPAPLFVSPASSLRLESTSNELVFNVVVSDANTPSSDLKFSITGEPDDLVKLSPVRSGKAYQWEVTVGRKPGKNGDCKLAIEVSGKGGPARQSRTLTVFAPPPPPMFVSSASPLRMESTSNELAFNVAVLDTNTPSAELKFSITGSPEDFTGIKTVRSSKDYQWDVALTRKSGKSGDGKLAMEVTGKWGTAKQSRDLFVAAPPLAPMFVSPPASVRIEAVSNQVVFSVTVSDTNTAFTDMNLTAALDSDSMVDIKAARSSRDHQWNVTVSRKPGKSGNGKIFLETTGRGGSAKHSLDLTVLEVPPPTLQLQNSTPLVMDAKTDSLELRFVVSDLEVAAQDLKLSVTSDSEALIVSPRDSVTGNRSVTLNRNSNNKGTATITAVLRAGSRSTTGTYTVQVDGLQPSFVLLDKADQSLDANAADFQLKVRGSAVDPSALQFISTDPTLLPEAGIRYEPASGANDGYVVLKPLAGRLGKLAITVIGKKSRGAIPSSNVINLTITGQLKLPKLVAEKTDFVFEMDGTAQTTVSVSSDYNITPEQLKLEVVPALPGIVKGEADGNGAQRTVKLTSQSPGVAKVDLNLTSPNGSKSTTPLSVKILPALPPQIVLPADLPPYIPVISGTRYEMKPPINVSDNFSSPEQLKVEIRSLSGNIPGSAIESNQRVSGTNLLVDFALNSPDSLKKPETLQIVAQDALGHKATNEVRFDFQLPVDTITNSVGMVLHWIKALPGSERGSWNGRKGGAWVGQYEVTQSQYVSVMHSNPSNYRGEDAPNFPVEHMSFDQAARFCDELTVVDRVNLPAGWKYTLPTEEQWLFFAAGSPVDTDHAYFADSKATKPSEPIAVGKLQPNPFGLYDVLGNVAELTKTPWPTDSFHYIRRGGGFRNVKFTLSPDKDLGDYSNRGYWTFVKENDDTGFRVILVPGDGN